MCAISAKANNTARANFDDGVRKKESSIAGDPFAALSSQEYSQLKSVFYRSFLDALLNDLASAAIDGDKSKEIEITKAALIFRSVVEIEWDASAEDRCSNLVHMIRAIARIAFAAGKVSEGEIDDLLRQAQSRRAKASAAKRKADAENGWRKRALSLMQKCRTENPAGTYDDLADYALRNWGVGKKPGRDSLKKQARVWINTGELAPKKK